MPKIKISELKKSLAECHIDSSDEKLKFLLDVKDPSYFLQRTMEAIHECQLGIDIYENSLLAVQLMNLFRVFHRNDERDASVAFSDDGFHESPTVHRHEPVQG